MFNWLEARITALAAEEEIAAIRDLRIVDCQDR